MTNKEISNSYVGASGVDRLYLGGDLVWPITPPGPVPYDEQYLTFGVLSDGDIVWANELAAEQPITIEYSKNDGPWTQITSASGSSAPAISVVSGDTVRFRGDNLAYTGVKQGGAYRSSFRRSTCTYNLYGNMMSMVDSTGFAQVTSIPSGMDIQYFFAYQGPVDASNMVLPATALTDYCYQSMFSGCDSLTEAPALPATTLAEGCYSDMFGNCTSLTQAPALPATALTDYCYQNMFSNCTSLTEAPELPATALTTSCYLNMFGNCTSLTQAPALPATTLANYCYNFMFYGCTSLTQAPAILPATTLAEGCYSDMFGNCTSLTQAPAILPATALTDYCYHNMFSNCTSLTEAPELPATALTTSCYGNMFEGCTSLNTITCLAANPQMGWYTSNWTDGVATTGTFVKKAGVTWPTGTDGIPSGWTVLDYTP